MFYRIQNKVQVANVRYDTMEGRQHVVVPTVMLMEGVFNGSQGKLLYLAPELSRSSFSWNCRPVVIDHPTMNGQGVSACSPEVLEKQRVGFLFNTSFDSRLKTEAWLDVDKLRKIDSRVLEAIQNGRMMEVSTGLYHEPEMTKGIWNGRDYDGIVRNIQPDHLAILPDQIGACSVQDGAGLLRNAHGLSHNDVMDHLHTEMNGTKDSYDSPKPYSERAHVREVMPNHVIYEKGDKHYKHSYKVKDGVAKLSGDPEEVRKQTSYVCCNTDQLQGPIRTGNVPALGRPKLSEMSDIVKRQQFQKTLEQHYAGVQQEGDWGGWVTDLVANFVVYSKDGKLFRLPYTYDDDMIRFDGEAEEVETYTDYRAKTNTPIDGTMSPNQNRGTPMAAPTPPVTVNVIHQGAHALIHDPDHATAHSEPSKGDGQVRTLQTRKEKVDHMIKNGGWGEGDRGFLEGLPDDHFEKVSSHTVKGAAQPIVPYTTEGIGDRSSVHSGNMPAQNRQQLTTEQYIAQAPSGIRDVLNAAVSAHEARKKHLIGIITANKANRFNPEWLKLRGMEELEGIASLASASIPQAPTQNFSGQADVPPMFLNPTLNAAANAGGDGQVEILQMTSDHWNTDKKAQ